MEQKIIESIISVFLLMSLGTVSCQQSKTKENPISRENLKTTIDSLCLPVFEGRGLKTKGSERAACYLESKMKSIGLKPLFSSGSYIQEFDRFLSSARKRNMDGAIEILITNGTDITHLEPYYIKVFGKIGSTDINGELVFAGYGIVSDSYNDFDNINIKDKVVCIMRGEPDFITKKYGATDGVYSNHGKIQTKIANAKQRGAIAVLIVSNPKDLNAFLMNRKNGIYFSEFSNVPFLSDSSYHIPTLLIGHQSANDLLKGFDLNHIESKINNYEKPNSFAGTGVSINIKINYETATTVSRNVIGIIEGSDPDKKKHAIIIGAHYDQDGISKGRALPGADDNATGTAAVIELARAIKEINIKPEHTLIFIAYDGEEPQGGASSTSGSDYFCETLESFGYKTHIAINLDMIGHGMRSRKLLIALLQNIYPARQTRSIYSSNMPGSNVIESIESEVSAKSGMKVVTENGFSKNISIMLLGDHQRFYYRKIPFISLYDASRNRLHTHRDTPSSINFKKVYKVTTFTYELIKLFDQIDGPISFDELEWDRSYSEFVFTDYRY